MHYLIIIAGPTAIGKTALAIDIAQAYGTEIISADSRQIYQELVVGVARPSMVQLKQVKHHFIGSVSIKQTYNAGTFAQDTEPVLVELFKKHRVVVLVGGSGLYIRALVEGLDKFPEVSEEVRQKWVRIYQEHGVDFLANTLQQIDADYYAVVDKSNPQRLMRALEVWDASGKPYSTFLSQLSPTKKPYEVIPIVLEMPRSLLYERINTRVHDMMHAGLLEEVKNLRIHRDNPALKTVGYKELNEVLDGIKTLETAVSEIQQHTRNYAKRQITWFNKYLIGPRFNPEEKDKILAYLKKNIHDKVNLDYSNNL